MITIRMGHRSPGSVMATRRFSLSLLLLLLLLQSVAAAVIVKTRKHPVGHVLDLPPLSDDHLKGFRFVGLIDPPRLRKRNRKGKVVDGTPVGSVTWYVQRSKKQVTKSGAAAFKLRLVKMEPRGVAAAALERGDAIYYEGTDLSGKRVVSLGLVKPKPWWRRLA